ncbi:efflux transporter outer membrane subunit [Massilia atriviolacea]|uniref:Efflux transporter outer membrane subunit n=1 Tax=Massilia atriviolacea TaxID=2495579 RepID=A0A430HC55_9BURK|nr:efflux transporter outer membrane subunit [Massilia atriviolacea]RSZ55094.1 efflux transporter outer membrane subunit [Massilia atriviolacea]
MKRTFVPMLAAASLLAGCSVGPVYQAPAAPGATRFQASLPQPAAAGAGQASDLTDWWRQFDDPLVAQLVDAALAGNPSLAQSFARIERARAESSSAGSALLPALDLSAYSQRQGVRSGGVKRISSNQARSLDASWEIDLFGAVRKGAQAADARVAARSADWHAVRVSLVAEVSGALVNYRACGASLAVLGQDAASREQTAQLTRMKIKAGFTSTANGLLSDASFADARQRVVAQRAECDLYVKALVALTDIPEASLRTRLAGSDAVPRPREFVVNTVPAALLSQRPDIASAEAELQAASADINVAQARRYPRITLGGSIGLLRFEGSNDTANGWSFLPQMTVPLFDGGKRRADVKVAQARFDEARAGYEVKVRNAVRETEEALVRLDALTRREADAAAAARDYERYLQSGQDRYRAGPGSLFELEDARRTALTARQVLINVQHERVLAWIALYKALGGGWHGATVAARGADAPAAG